MVGLDGHAFEQALGDGEEQGSLGCCSPWGGKQMDLFEILNSHAVFMSILATCTYSFVFSQDFMLLNWAFYY